MDYTLLGKTYVRMAALPTDRFPSDVKASAGAGRRVAPFLTYQVGSNQVFDDKAPGTSAGEYHHGEDDTSLHLIDDRAERP